MQNNIFEMIASIRHDIMMVGQSIPIDRLFPQLLLLIVNSLYEISYKMLITREK